MTVSESINYSVRGDSEIRESSAEAASAMEGYAEVSQDDGFISMVLPPGAVITGGIAARAAAEFQELAGAVDKPLLLELTGIESITRSARTVFGSARSASAVAVVGSTQVDRVIANFLLGGDLPPCPTKYFSSKPDALAWLGSRAG
ncbi:DUF7793 family protein [Arthrobacter luteolus]|uniref:DUF7793 family protein n=1 Tax=Arthrobacter luteolus TaxID=98672 RepID=UPI000AD5697E|nr:STAS/SEC14 domain-containing protein [Arthrobacter luteolus]